MKEYRETEEFMETKDKKELSQEDLTTIEKNLGQLVEVELEEARKNVPAQKEPPEKTEPERENRELDQESEEPEEGPEEPEEEGEEPEEGSEEPEGEGEEPEEGSGEEPEEEGEKAKEADREPGALEELEELIREEEEAALTRGKEKPAGRREKRRRAGFRKAGKQPSRKEPINVREKLEAAGRLLRRFLRSRWFRYLAVLAGVLFVVLFAAHVVRNWTYRSYEISAADNQTDTTSFHYCSLGDSVLRYGLDSAMLTSPSGENQWSVSYSMQSPALALCGGTAAIYDRSGTTVVVCDEEGQIGTIRTELPILKAEVAAQGVVAAILEDDSNTWIQYYDQQGEQIASFRTAMDATGYPLDIGLSSNGLLLGVSYLRMENGVPKTELKFYNFGNAGQIQMDNQVSSYTYENLLIPEVAYLDESTCVAFLENGFAVFQGGQIPEKVKEVTTDREIISVFWDDSHIGLILENEDPEFPFLLNLYGPSGKELFSRELDYPYQNVEMGAGRIVLSNRTGFCVYSTEGVEKFRGELAGQIVQDLFAVGRTRFMLVAEDGLYSVRIK